MSTQNPTMAQPTTTDNAKPKQQRFIGEFRGSYASNAYTLFNGLLYYTDATREQAHAAANCLMSDAANNKLEPGTLEVGKRSKNGQVSVKLGKGEAVKAVETYALALNRLVTSIDGVKRYEKDNVEVDSFKHSVRLSGKIVEWLNEKWRIHSTEFDLSEKPAKQ